MNDLPHSYTVACKGTDTGSLMASADNLAGLAVGPPLQFGGPGNEWSPEDLLMASVSSCLVLSFRAIAKASKFNWSGIECISEGQLDKVDRDLRFTKVSSRVKLVIPATESKEKAEKLLHKAEGACLISNSLSCDSNIECEILVDGE